MANLELRKFGSCDFFIPPLVFGATSLGNLFRVVDDAEKSAIVEAWVQCDLQPVVIDSAGKYGAGLSLEVIGRELERLDVARDRVIISNKLAWRRVPLRGGEPSFEPGAWFGLEHDAIQDISYDGILRCWREGNELLRGRNAQLVSVHDPDEYLAAASDASQRRQRMQDLVGAYRALRELKSAGQVRAVGGGAKNWLTIRELVQYCDVDWIMIANSFTLMHHPPELATWMDALRHRGVAIINSALFHGGFLVGGEFFDYRRLDPNLHRDAERLQWRQRLNEACRELQTTPFQLGVAFGAAHPAVTAVALSSARAERVGSHIAAVSRTVPKETWRELQSRGLLDESCQFLFEP